MVKYKKIVKKYMREIKSFFPVLRADDRKYINKLSKNIYDYCESADSVSIDQLYSEFGHPLDTAHAYFSMIDLDSVFSYIQLQRVLKKACLAILFCVLFFLTFYCTLLYKEHQTFLRQEAVFIEDTITD